MGQFHHSRDSTKPIYIDFFLEIGIDIGIEAVGVRNEVLLRIPFLKQTVGVVGHGLGQVDDFVLVLRIIVHRYPGLCAGCQRSGQKQT